MNVFEFIENHDAGRKWSHIIVHHSLTADGRVVDWTAIERYHVNYLGWHNIGYNFGIEFVDARLEYMIGRGLETPGAHTKGMNEKAIGICMVGNFDLIEPSHQHYFMCASLCRALMSKYGIPLNNVLPHWAFALKTCPGKHFSILKLRDYIEGITNAA